MEIYPFRLFGPKTPLIPFGLDGHFPPKPISSLKRHFPAPGLWFSENCHLNVFDIMVL